MNDDEQPIITEVKKRMNIVEFTKMDRAVQYFILAILIANLLMIISFVIPWGSF